MGKKTSRAAGARGTGRNFGGLWPPRGPVLFLKGGIFSRRGDLQFRRGKVGYFFLRKPNACTKEVEGNLAKIPLDGKRKFPPPPSPPPPGTT